MNAAYAGPVGGVGPPEPPGAAGHSTGASPVAAPPPALKVGDRIELHLFSCHNPDQHQRAVIGGYVAAQLGEGWLVRLDRPVEEFGGQLVEGLGFARPGSCPNAVSAATEEAA